MLEMFQNGQPDRMGRILALTKRLGEIREAADLIRFDQDLAMELPEALRTLGEAKNAVIAELKTV
jgi:hypothetical protein